MRFRNVLSEVMGSRTKVKVIRTLLNSAKKEMTSREISMLAGVSLPKTIEVLGTLEEHGAVTSRQAGKSILWQLKEGSYVLGKLLRPAFAAEADMLEEVKRRIVKALGNACERMVLFGSVAQGEERAESDIDLFVLVKGERERETANKALEGLQAQILDDFKAVISPMVYTRKEMEGKRGSKLMAEIDKGVNLCG